MRSFRSRPVDLHTAALARARVAYVAGRRGAVATEPADVTSPDRPGEGHGDAVEPSPRRHARRARSAPPDGPLDDPPWPPEPGSDQAWAGEPPTPPDPAWARPGSLPPRSAHPAAADYDDDAGPQPAPSDASRLPLRFGRLGLERVHLAVIVLVVAAGAIGAVVLFLLARPEVVPVEPELVATGTPVETPPSGRTPDAARPGTTGSRDDEPDAAAETPEDAAAPIVIHVAGLVARPGVVQLPSGSRVVDAIEAAGGATPEADLTPINLARVLTDGEQVLVTADPPPAAPPAAPPAGEPSDPEPPGPVNLNTATAAELETLPGIGPTLAGRILEWRDQNGRFTSVEELREVSGIGEQRFAELEPLVTL